MFSGYIGGFVFCTYLMGIRVFMSEFCYDARDLSGYNRFSISIDFLLIFFWTLHIDKPIQA